MDRARAPSRLAPEIRHKLAMLRRRIRLFIIGQGLAVAAMWVALTFWLGLAMDYLPILVGASEMPRAARVALLAIVAGVLGYIAYRWILRRIFVHLADTSMAVLLERKFADLGESLITSVELSNSTEHATPERRQMLAATQLRALQQVQRLRIADVFNVRPLLLPMLGAAILVLTMGAFYAFNSQAFALGVQRLYLLEDAPWPRRAHIEIVGVEATHLAFDMNAENLAVPFDNQSVTVARGAEVSLLVRADAEASVVPETCTISYATADGDRGRVNMTRVGQIRDGHQLYRYDGKPLRGILSDVQFDVVGFDHRVGPHVISVVDHPVVVRAELDCQFPSYMVDESTSSWLPRSLPLSTGTRIPRGTSIAIRAESNKPLREIYVAEVGGEGTADADVRRVSPISGGHGFECELGSLHQSLNLQVTLVDTDNVTSETPYRVYIEAVEDTPPTVDVRLRGIGSAVTPDVRIALEGTAQDDYAIDSTWVEMLVNDTEPSQHSLQLSGTDVGGELDFRRMARTAESIRLEPDDRLVLTPRARDFFALSGEPHVGSGDAFQLEVVTPQRLLAILETRELGLRQRLEQIIDETRETRDSLLRVQTIGPNSVGDAPTEPSPSDDSGNENSLRQTQALSQFWSLRLLRAQRALLQGQKSAQETTGVALSFRDICEELINNRVDSQDRQERLLTQVAEPLEAISRDDFKRLEGALQQLVETLDRSQDSVGTLAEESPPVVAAAEQSIAVINRILLKFDEVLQNMMQLEDYNSLLDVVRSLIDEQQRLVERTKQEQKRQVLQMFE